MSAPARLDELAAVTKEYARYSRSAFGLASVFLGAWLLATLAVLFVSAPAAAVLSACGPLAWIFVVPRVRAYYQRHGRVLEAEPDMSGLAPDLVFPAFLWMFALLSPLSLWKHHGAWAAATGVLGWVALAAAAVALFAAAVLMPRRLEGTRDRMYAVLLPWNALATHDAGWLSTLVVATLGLCAVLFVGKGIHDHLAFRHLERRLATLRPRA